MFNYAFGPSESCGQRIPITTHYFGKGLKVTQSGNTYGWMDYGSRFLVIKNEYIILERIVGVTGNHVHFYGTEKFEMNLDMNERKLEISYIGHRGRAQKDFLHITRDFNRY